MIIARVGKLFGVAPSYYLLGEDGYFKLQIDLACAAAYWTDENHHYEKSKTKSHNESFAIGKFMDNYREQLEARG